MPELDAVLVDVFDTMLSVDFDLAFEGLVDGSVLSRDEWQAGLLDLGAEVMCGSFTQHQAFAEVHRRAGKDPDGTLDRLVELDRRLLVQSAVVHPDTIPFLEAARGRGLKVAFVSNCAENAGPLLRELGLWEYADAVLLSCEVGSTKPDPGIFHTALDAVHVEDPGRALFVDDQPHYCAGARAVGINAIEIARFDPGASVRSFQDVLPLLDHPPT